MENSLFYTQFSPLNAGNHLLGLCNFKIFWGSMPPDTPWKRGLFIQSVTLFKSAGYFSFYRNPSSFSFWKYNGQFMFHRCQFVMYSIYTPLVLSNPTPPVHQDPWHELCNHQSHKLQTESWQDKRNSVRILWNDLHATKYRKILQISPGAYIFQRLFFRGLYSKRLIYGEKFAFQNWVG